MMPTDTLPRLLRRNAASMGARPAMREKRHGIWQALTWSDYETVVLRLAGGLDAAGFRRGDRLAVLGDNRPRLYAALLAAQALGGAGMPVWPDAEPGAIAAALGDAGVTVAVVEDQEQLGKLLAVKDQLPSLMLVVVLDPRAARGADAAWLRDIGAIEQHGAALPDPLEGITEARPGDLALLLPSLDAPGAVMLTHANLLAAAHAITTVEQVRATDETMAFMPMAWVGDALYSLTLGLHVGFTCNCPEGPETARRDLREIGPHILAVPPPLWDTWLADIEHHAAHSSGLKRATFAWARRQAEHAEHLREAGLPTNRLGVTLRDRLVFAAVRDHLGLGRLRWAHTGGTPVAPPVWRLFRAFGVNLKQSYGPTELSGLAAVQPANPVSADTLGLPVPGTELRIGDGGEVMARGETVCLGYHAAPERTCAAHDADAWWHTGDAGSFDARGRLSVLDRLAHLGRLQDGTDFVPRAIEGQLRRSRFIDDALACGDGREFVAALVVPDRAALAEWAEQRRVPTIAFAELLKLPEVQLLLGEEIGACNADLAPALRVRRFRLLAGSLRTEDVAARLDRDRQRGIAVTRLAAEIEALFDHHDAAIAVPGAAVSADREVVHA
jgi:long-chain acyl-CoA synthetase